jgi:hypothetical protein
LADFVASAEFRDNLSAGMASATAALNKAADAADNVTTATTRVGSSFETLLRRADPAALAAAKLAAAQRDLARDTATANAALAAGTATQTQRDAVVDRAASRVQALSAATAAAGASAGTLSAAQVVAAGTADSLGASHGQLKSAVAQSHIQFSQFVTSVAGGQPIMTSAMWQFQGLNDVLTAQGVSWKALGSAVLASITPTVAMVAAGAALAGGVAYLGYSAESAAREIATLQTALRATRDDYSAMAAEAIAAGKAVGATTGIGTTDAKASAGAFAASPSFVGSQAQLQALVVEANDLALVMGVTLPVATDKLVAAMKDPAKLAQEWADSHSFGMTQALADQIKIMADSGDKAGAFGRDLDALKSKTSDVATASKTELQLALDDLSKAFTSAGSDGKSFADVLGNAVTSAASTALGAISGLVRGINSARAGLANSGQGGYIPGAEIGSVNPVLVGPNTSISTAVSNRIYATAEARNYAGDPNVSAVQADFATQIAFAESGGKQLGPDGKTLTSDAGALGIMQLKPGTAAGLGVDPTNGDQNIDGGLKYINQLWTKYGGNPGLVAMAYNWGPGNVDELLSGVKTLADVPAETKAFVPKITGKNFESFLPGGGNVSTGTLPGGPEAPLPVPPNPNDIGVANTSLVSDAIAKADKANTPISAALNAGADIKMYTAALADLAAHGDTSSASVLKLRDALTQAQVALQNAHTPADLLIDSLGRQADAQDRIAAAYSGGMSAVDHMTNLTKAEEDARKMAGVTTENYALTVLKLTTAYDALSRAQQNKAAAAGEFDQRQELTYLQAQTATLGESADIRARDLAVLKEQQTIDKTMPDLEAAQKDKLLANAAAIADANTALQQQQADLQAISGMMTQVFDQVGQAITQAFVNGNGAAVNWGNVTRAVIASVIQEMLKLAILNPILNSLSGGNLSTLTGVVNTVAGTATAGGGSSMMSSGGSILSTGSSLYSAYNGLLGNTGLLTSGGMLSTSSTGGFLGLTGAGGSMYGAGGVLYTGMGAESAAMASAPLAAGESGAVATGATASTGAGALGGASGAISAATPYVGGVGIGFAAGSLVGGKIQSGQSKTGPAPMIGAATGAVAGALIGGLAGPWGALAGGVIGGIAGGLTGGFIGPHTPNGYSSTDISLNNGLLSTGAYSSQNEAVNVESTLTDAKTINDFLSSHGLSISSTGGISQIGDNTEGGFQDPSKATSIEAAFGGFRFASNDNTLNKYLSGKSFDLATLESDVTAYQNLVGTVIPALTKQATVTGSLNDAITQINAAFDPAITAANKYGVATDSLTAAQTAAVKAANDAAAAQLAATDAGFTARYMTASASISGDPAAGLAEQLYVFDQNVQPQKDALKAQLEAVYGTAYETTAAYADQQAQLEKTLGQERLAIQQAYNDKLTATATQGVTSLESYILKLQTGSTSPLSPSAQYGLASSQFDAVAGAAKAGDYNSYASLSGYADSLLASSQAMNGSGSAYVADFNRVLDVLTSLAQVTPDTLTASVYQTETQTQTQALVKALAQVKASVDSLKQAVNAPSRIANA